MLKRIILCLLCLLPAALPAAERDVAVKRGFGYLCGTLLTPEAGSDVAVLIIAGSGPTDRNCNAPYAGLATNSFRYLAQALEAQGIASLRYDKRGIGASRYDDPEGIYGVTFDDYVSDAAAWVAWLRAQGYKKVVLAGHSEGSLIALCLGAGQVEDAICKPGDQSPKERTAGSVPGSPELPDSSRIDGIVSLSGAGFPMDELLLTQLAARLAPENIGLLMRATAVVNSLRQGKTVDDYPKELSVLFLPYLQRYLISEIKYKPQELIRRVKVPVLIVNGDNDLQVSTADAEALKRAKPDAELLIINGMTHTLKQSDGHDIQGQTAAYTDVSLPLDPTLAEAVPRFIRTL